MQELHGAEFKIILHSQRANLYCLEHCRVPVNGGRVEYVTATDDETLDAFQLLCRTEGIIPAIESSHAVAHAMKLAPTLGADDVVVVNLSGRGDKDIDFVAERLGMS